MSEHDSEIYNNTLKRVQRQVQTLRVMLDSIQVCNLRHILSVFSPGRFGVSGRYPLRAEGISADTPCVCTALAQCAAN